jgi:lactate dehydrogenase-like 2-hydroxyacid dehydrogenase
VARVHVTRRLPARVEDELAGSFELVPEPDGVDGLLVNPGDPVDAALLDRAGPSLRVVANFGVGYDNVDLPAATERGVVVANTPGVLTEATAELTIALLLALLRRVPEGDRLVRRRDPWRLDPTFMLGRGLRGLRLGVVGMGRIGREVARLAEAHGMEVVPVGRGELDRLADVDVVTLHIPMRPETRHLVDAGVLARLRPGAVLVNTSRGPVVDEAALVAALEEGRLAGAALDVFEHEPDVHPGLLGREDVVLTPHLGSATQEAREAMGMLCVDALRDVLLEGRLPRHALNPEAVA